MKKTLIMSLIASSLIYSCSSEREFDSETNSNSNAKTSAKGRKSVCDFFENSTASTVIPGIKAVNLDNSLATSCQNNILIFPTLQDYENAIVKLDQQIEDYNDAFDQQTAGMTDTEADDYAESVDFDENQPLIDFEKELKFCSLRQHLANLDDAWLDQQVDGAWDLNTSPDEYYIDDETERALLSLGSEFIVGDCKNGYTLYKRYDWGYASFAINDIGTATDILTALNNITNPTQQPININGATQGQVSQAVEPYKDSGVTVVATVPAPQGGYCHSEIKDKGEYLFSPERKIVWKHKFKDAHFPNFPGQTLMKTYTRSYRKKKGKWKKFKATIYTGFYGKTATAYQCNDYGSQSLTGKEKRRKKVKQREYLLGDLAVKKNVFFSVHKQEGNSYENEVY
ncbi:hypothetical protein [Chryseobacterium hagamense]|uniref:DUF4848 domain-containing protein n=1 Tax=Chryseobacterium hagamense TaxID=395935 RepID=A0A511YM07_9FLAO|nr:hypothetical protein [Chryseobacterium hagamense]GEN76238.1 hypothetical protein CHA01nite_19780 [Chryseobacterium hagamense]